MEMGLYIAQTRYNTITLLSREIVDAARHKLAALYALACGLMFLCTQYLLSIFIRSTIYIDSM